MLVLIRELEGDLAEMERVLSRNTTAWERIEGGADDPVDWGALGFTIQTLYGILENYFLRISKYFENNLPRERWHQALIEKMTVDLPGMRPALLTREDQVARVRELVRFRHRLRNLYGEDLDPYRTRTVQETVIRFFSEFPEIHSVFVDRLRRIADVL